MIFKFGPVKEPLAAGKNRTWIFLAVGSVKATFLLCRPPTVFDMWVLGTLMEGHLEPI